MAKYYKIKAKEGKTLPENVILPPCKSEDGGLVISIDDNGFAERYEIESFTISENIKYIGTGALSGCANLQKITVNKTEKEVQTLNWPTNWNNGITVVYKSAVKYRVSVNSSYGNVTGLNEDFLYEEGDIVTFKVDVNSGYTLESVKYNNIELVASGEQYSFEMPAQNIIITINYKSTNEPGDDPVQPEIPNARFYTYDDNGDRTIEYLTLSTNTIGDNTLSGYNFTIASKFTTDEYIIYSPYPVQEIYIKGVGNSWGTEIWTNNGTETLDGYNYYKYTLVPAQLVSTSSTQFCAVTI